MILVRVLNGVDGLRKSKLIKVLTLIVGIVFSMSGIVYAKDTAAESKEDYSKLEQFIQDEMKKSNIPGAAVSIISNNEVFSKGFGTYDNSGKEVNSDTLFKIGSISKTFTAISIMQLAEKGKIDLDTPIENYVPWLIISVPKGSPKITVKHLLTHTSGFKMGAYQDVLFSNEGDISIKERILKIKDLKTIRPAGEKWEYSNLGFLILGAAIEEVTGQSYKEYLRKNILEPLDMKNTYLSEKELPKENVSEGFEPFFGRTYSFYHPYQENCVSVGWIYSSANDMAHYMSMLLNEGSYNNKTILSAESFKKMTWPVVTDPSFQFGLGMFIESGMFYHGGDHENYHAFMVINPIDKKAGFLVYNSNHMLYSVLETIGLKNIINKYNVELPSINFDGAMKNIMKGHNPTEINGVNIVKVQVVINIILLGILLGAVILFFRLTHWRKKFRGGGKSKVLYLIWGLLINILMPIAALSYEAMTKALYNTAPDLAIEADLIFIVLLITGVRKILILFSEMSNKRKGKREFIEN